MTVQKIPPAPTWDLDSIFPGGSKSAELKNYREGMKTDLAAAAAMLKNLPAKIDNSTLQNWVDFILKLQSTLDSISTVMSFAGCLTSQNVKDDEAHAIEGEVDNYYAEWKKMSTELEAKSLDQSDDQWKMLTGCKELKDIEFFLNEVRSIAKSKMPLEKEALALELSVNGYHAWNRLYDKMAGDLRGDFEEDGETKSLSIGQLAAKMSDGNRDIRKRAFESIYKAWETRADLAGMALNAQAGFRLSLYKNRKWDSVMQEPLVQSRLKEETLNAMWEVIAEKTSQLKPFIEAKKRLLGIDKYRWFDQFAPCGNSESLYSYEEAGDFIIKNIEPLSTEFADFVKMALKDRWIEAEDRTGKAGGGFCTNMNSVKQSRIFMTYNGTFENLLTLAHELGHAYHQWVVREKPLFSQDYPMPLAETASIFSETLVIDAALEKVDDAQEKLMLLDQKLQAAYTMFSDIHCRYLFDKMFYAERAKGIVQKDRLKEMMIEAQKKAFGDLLDPSGYHDLFWCSKLHFYITEAPFYNFPYTFGYLFSGGVYDRARKEGSAFANKYRDLLADTGCMQTEDLAQKHLGVDLTKKDFWNDAVNRSLSDVDAFVKLAGSK